MRAHRKSTAAAHPHMSSQEIMRELARRWAIQKREQQHKVAEGSGTQASVGVPAGGAGGPAAPDSADCENGSGDDVIVIDDEGNDGNSDDGTTALAECKSPVRIDFIGSFGALVVGDAVDDMTDDRSAGGSSIADGDD